MNKQNQFQIWLILLSVLSKFEKVGGQLLENMSNVGNIVLEQDPRDQDPFYRNYYARAEGMPLAAVNSVVHNVKHQSEGQFKLWHELPSHKVRPGYTTTTKAPKIKTTTVPWVRGRHRPQLGQQQQAPWFQKFSDPDGYDTGTDYEEGVGAGAPPSRPRGRRPPGGRGRRPPAPSAPVRVQVGKGEGLLENGDGGGFAGSDEGTKSASEGTEDSEGVKMTTTAKTTTKAAPKTTKKPENQKKEIAEGGDDEGTKKEEGNEDEGTRHGEIDLADLKSGGVVHKLRTSGKGKTVGEKEDEEEEEEEDTDDEEDSKKEEKKAGKKKGKEKKNDDEEDEKKSKKKSKKRGKKKEEDDENERKSKKGKKSKKKDDKDEEEDDENGGLKKVDGDVKIPKAVDGDTDGHHSEEEEDYNEEGDEDEDEDKSSKRKHNKRRNKKNGKKKDEEEEYDDEEDNDDDDEDEEDFENEDSRSKPSKEHRQMKSKKTKCPPPPQRHQPTHPAPPHHQNNPPNQVPYPQPDVYGYTHPTPPTTTMSTQHSQEGMGDDYHAFESMDCKENQEDDEEDENEDHLEEHKKKKKKKSKKNLNKKGKKKNKKSKGGKKGHASLDYLTSREKIDQNKRNRGHILDELHADQDLKKIRKTAKSPDSGIDCSTAVDEFPLKCGSWKSAGFCDTNQATQFLWCRKTCLCSANPIVSTTTTSSNFEE